MTRLNPDLDGSCPHCRDDATNELETLEHWLCDCVAHAARRMELFGRDHGELEWLTSEPEAVIAFARATLAP